MAKIIITVDRIEEEYAVCINDDLTELRLPVSLFSDGVSENDVFDLTLERRNDTKNERMKKIYDRFKRLTNKERQDEN